MKNIFLTIAIIFTFPLFASSQIKEEAKSLKNELKKNFFSSNIQKPVKIAVIDFDEKSEDAKKSKTGSVFSAALAEQLIIDTDFIVAERQKLENVFKELRLSASGAIDEKELKRTGLILGVDWLVVGDISDSGENFLVQARIVNVENGVAASAGSVAIERSKLIKESEEYFSKKYRTTLYLGFGSLNISDIEFKSNIITAQIRRKFGKKLSLGFGISQNLVENDSVYKADVIAVNYGITSDTIFRETFKSAFILNTDIDYTKRIAGLNLKAAIGLSFNILTSKQQYYFANGGSAMGTDPITGLSYNVPASYDHKYYIPSFDLKFSAEKEISNSFILGTELKYSKFSFKRNMEPENENSLLRSYADTLNKRIKTSALYIGIKAGFGF